MHIATYRFQGDPATLTEGYHRLAASFPPGAILLNVAVEIPDGLLVIDACPTEADFHAFSTSAGFAAALADAGLPSPSVESVGSLVATLGTSFGG